MKVLILTPYILFEDVENFTKNTTGFAIMMNDIATSLANSGIDVGILTQSSITKGKKIGGINIIKRTWIDILTSVKLCNIQLGFKLMFKNGFNIRNISRCLFYSISGGYVEKVIKKEKPDIVHIHSLGVSVLPFIFSCLNCKVPFVITTHGLIPNNSKSSATEFEKGIENKFYKLSVKRNIPVTVISSGMKYRIEEKIGIEHPSCISVVTNGTDIENIKNEDKIKVDIRKKFGISKNNKIILCVGSICDRKNQMQVIKAFAALEQDIKNNLTLLILGNDTTNGLIQNEINKLNLNNEIRICGFISRNIINEYYRQADYNILASIDEGFGLSIIEALTFGIPTVTFSDLDAVKDLYNDKCMIIVEQRSDIALANGITELFNRSWDKNYITSYSKMFSLDAMAKNYISIYKKTKASEMNKNDFYDLIRR